MITYEDFQKVEIKVGKILSAEKVPDTDKLLRLVVDFGEETGPRQVISGIAMYHPDPSVLAGHKSMFVTNLEPRTIRGLESQAMIFAVSTDSAFSLLEPSEDIPVGTAPK